MRPSGFVKLALLAALAVGGLASGLYLSGVLTNCHAPEAKVNRFPLSPLDVKETAEAPDLAVDGGGRIYLVWPSKLGDDERKLFLSTSDDGGRSFADPRVIARSGVYKAVSQMKNGKTMSREVRMAPHVAASDQGIHLVYTETLPDNAGVRTVAALSTDRGQTFSTPIPIHQEAATRATYTALFAAKDGALLCSWLDNRNKSQQTFAALRRSGQPNFEPEQLVHAGDDKQGVCPCCPTACLLGADGTEYVAFRNIDKGYRDFVVGRKKPGETSYQLFPVVPPTWTFNGCPHDGASLGLFNGRLSVVWMDAHTGSQRCYFAQANVADMKFEARELHAIPTGTQGNAKIRIDACGGVHAVWEESLEAPIAAEGHNHDAAPKIGGGRAIQYAAMLAGESKFSPPRAVAPKAGAFQTRPSISFNMEGEPVIAWNELDEQGKAVVVTILKSE